jgi:hypothetical protein
MTNWCLPGWNIMSYWILKNIYENRFSSFWAVSWLIRPLIFIVGCKNTIIKVKKTPFFCHFFVKKLFLSKRKSLIIYDFPHFPYTYHEEIGRYISETRNNCVLNFFFRRYQTDPVRGLTDAKAKANLGRVNLPGFSCFSLLYFCSPTRIP